MKPNMVLKTKIKHITAFILLMLTLVSVSGFTSVSTHYEKQKIELVSTKKSNKSSVAQYQVITHTSQIVGYSYFTIFNFSNLLKKHQFDISIALKAQKNVKILFLDYQFLKQNLIAQINSSNYKNNFI